MSAELDKVVKGAKKKPAAQPAEPVESTRDDEDDALME